MVERSRKGQVAIAADKERLFLAWSYGGKRYRMYLGLLDSPTNRRIAQTKAGIIEGDIATGNFDRTLAKYKPAPERESSLSVAALFDRFFEWKRPHQEEMTRVKYGAIASQLKQHFKNRPAEGLSKKDCEKYRDWLLTWQKPVTAKDRIGVIKAAWNWAIASGLLSSPTNPWKEVKVQVQAKRPDPFTREEVQKIIEGFEASKHYSYYTLFVRFMLASGLRTGEIIGLRWKHFSENCDRVDVIERLSRSKERKDTKNHRVRSLQMSPSMQKILLEYRPKEYGLEDLVFPAKEGGQINDRMFQRRAWTKVLTAAGVRYRKPYNSRHTALSHALAQGISPAQVAEMAGDRLDTVLRAYVGNVEGVPFTVEYEDDL